MKDILIVNRSKTNCGIYQYGINIFQSLKNSDVNNYYHFECDSQNEFFNFIKERHYDVVIFNWYRPIMSWVNDNTTTYLYDRRIKTYFIYHDGDYPTFKYTKSILYNDPTKIVNYLYEFNIGRCLFDYPNNDKPKDKVIISSFGFGFMDKGFDDVIKRVNDEFENATIRLHMPNASVDPSGILRNKTIENCYKELNNKNELLITSDYKNTNDLLDWLNESTINCFFYHKKQSNGISSVIDYALSVPVPIAVTECDMFRHIKNDDISIEKNSLKQIIEKGLSPTKNFREKWSNENFRINFDKIMNENG
jgi:hypothetical protein